MKKFALLGFPLEQSPSYITHNAVFKELGVDAIYELLPVKADELEKTLPRLVKEGYYGFSITLPLKELALTLVDHLSPSAKAIGAINTVVVKDNELFGDNTDGIGALTAIEKISKVKDKDVAIIGAGGTAKAICYEAMQRGARVKVTNRTMSRAEKLAKKLGCKAGPLGNYDVLINCTSVGMWPNIDAMPIEEKDIRPGSIVMDVVHIPQETLLLKKAKDCKTISGIELYIYQAIEQFVRFIDHPIDTRQVESILRLSVEDFIKSK